VSEADGIAGGRPSLLLTLLRGARRRCPNCGEGCLFERWLTVRSLCPKCATVLLEDQGDPWAFVVLFDRVFVLALIGIVYFQFGPPTTWGLGALFAAITAVFVYTTPHRFGVCVALAYRVRSDC
jgi:uncharacterized protein (DUF983 family)